MKTRPPYPAIMMLLMFCMLVSLGIWQMQRLAWKTTLLAQIEQQMQAAAVPLPENIKNPEGWEYRRATIAGEFLHDHEFLVGPRVYKSKNGFHLFTAFRRASNGIIFVNRGWVPDAENVFRPRGIVSIEGVVTLPRRSSGFTPDNQPDKNQWYWNDIAAMAKQDGLGAPLPLILTALPEKTTVWPFGITVGAHIPNNHKQYAIFWFFMAAALLMVYFIYRRQESKV